MDYLGEGEGEGESGEGIESRRYNREYNSRNRLRGKLKKV